MAQQIPSPASSIGKKPPSALRRVLMIPVVIFVVYLLFKSYTWVATPKQPQIIYADRYSDQTEGFVYVAMIRAIFNKLTAISRFDHLKSDYHAVVTAYSQAPFVATVPPTAMDGSNIPQSTTPDGHSHPPQPYDPSVGSTSASGVPQQMSPDPDHSMDWQDASFISNEADEVIPEDEDEAAYKRRKARERQRRKRQRDRAAGIGRNGQPAAPRRYPGTDVTQYDGTNPFADPPPDPAVLASMTPEEARKEKMRRAARERQRKHRAVIRARRAEDESAAAAPQSSTGASSGGGVANTSAVPESTLPVSASEPAAESHIEQDVNSGESHPVSYEQPPCLLLPTA
ncbi:hypothetical protein OPQ81_002379 [Rhizoctonia solani]|nr:hypothetical protein OPQ81_002379 [Rhizoctonia solani]